MRRDGADRDTVAIVIVVVAAAAAGGEGKGGRSDQAEGEVGSGKFHGETPVGKWVG